MQNQNVRFLSQQNSDFLQVNFGATPPASALFADYAGQASKTHPIQLDKITIEQIDVLLAGKSRLLSNRPKEIVVAGNSDHPAETLSELSPDGTHIASGAHFVCALGCIKITSQENPELSCCDLVCQSICQHFSKEPGRRQIPPLKICCAKQTAQSGRQTGAGHPLHLEDPLLGPAAWR